MVGVAAGHYWPLAVVATGAGVMILLALRLLLDWLSVRLFRAYLLMNGVRVGPNHFPHVHQAVEYVREAMSYRMPLEVYVLEGT